MVTNLMKITKVQRYFVQEVLGLILLISTLASLFFWFNNKFIDAPTMLGSGWVVITLVVLMLVNFISKISNKMKVEDTWEKISARKKRRKIGLMPNDVEPIYDWSLSYKLTAVLTVAGLFSSYWVFPLFQTNSPVDEFLKILPVLIMPIALFSLFFFTYQILVKRPSISIPSWARVVDVKHLSRTEE